MPKLKKAVKEFLGAVPPQDQVTLLGFNDSIFALTRKATDPAERVKAVDRLAPWGSTALYDVILRGVDMLGRQTGRKALVVFTDGEDQGSHATIDDVERRLQASDVTLYMIGQGRGVTMEPLKRIMERLSVPTGGRALFTDSIDELHDAFADLLDELSNQYLLGYQSTNSRRDDAWRQNQGRRRRSSRRARAAGVPRAGGQMTAHAAEKRAVCGFVVCGLLRVVCRFVACRRSSSSRRRSRSFQSSVEVTSLDVTVVDDKGKPISDAEAGRLHRPHRRQRRAASSQPSGCRSSSERRPAAAPPPDGYSTNENADRRPADRHRRRSAEHPLRRRDGDRAGRPTRSSIGCAVGPGGGRGNRPGRAGDARSRPIASGSSGPSRAWSASGSRAGCRPRTTSRWSRRIAIERGDRATLDAVMMRECAGICERRRALEVCRAEVESEAREKAQDDAQRSGRRRSRRCATLLTGLQRDRRAEDADPDHRRVRRCETTARIIELGAMAAAARTSLYALKLDEQLFDITRRAGAGQSDRRSAGPAPRGSSMLAGASRGALFTVTGAAQALFDRIESELSGYYLLGVESDGRDKDGKPHPIRIDVPRRGAMVRSRRQLRERSQRTSDAALAARRPSRAALASPLLVSALPVRVATFALQGPERDKVQLLIHADIGTDYAASKVVSIGYVHHRTRRPNGRKPVGRHAAAAGDERRAVGAAVHRRREPGARRIHAEARRRRRRSRRQRRAPDSRCARRRATGSRSAS